MTFLSLGVILKTRGLKGEIKVKSTTDFASLRYKKNAKVFLYDETSGQYAEAHVRSYTSSQGFDYLSFAEFPTVESILPFVGRKIVVDKDEQKPLGKDTYYFSDLVGCEVFDRKRDGSGKSFGSNPTLLTKPCASKPMAKTFFCLSSRLLFRKSTLKENGSSAN